jgi:hypothetical protein
MLPSNLQLFPVLCTALAVFVSACSQHPQPEPVVRPAMTNAEYELAQLRALGAATDGPGGHETGDIRVVRDDAVQTRLNLAPPNRILTPAPGTPTSPGAVAPTTSASSRTGPVQKAGAIYIGPGGTSSRRVGAIMINSDGTTGQMIGNTIFNH